MKLFCPRQGFHPGGPAPYGAGGLKFKSRNQAEVKVESRLVWGGWIEILITLQ